MKILVTGGAGFVGSHIVRDLLAGGVEVVVLDNFSTGKRENLPHHRNLTIMEGNIANLADVEKAMKGCDHVVHLAALVSVPMSIELPAETGRSNVYGFHNVLETARVQKMPGRLIYASSAAVYGRNDKGKVAERDAAGAALFSPYAASKVENESIAQVYAACYGMKTIGLRFFNIYGPGQDASSPYSGVLARVVDSVNTGSLFTIYGDGSQTRDFVAIGDVVQVVRGLLTLPVDAKIPPVMNLGSGVAVSVLDMIRHVVALRQINPRVEYRPARSGDVKHSCADVSLLMSVLPGWQPQTLQMGLRGWLLK